MWSPFFFRAKLLSYNKWKGDMAVVVLNLLSPFGLWVVSAMQMNTCFGYGRKQKPGFLNLNLSFSSSLVNHCSYHTALQKKDRSWWFKVKEHRSWPMWSKRVCSQNLHERARREKSRVKNERKEQGETTSNNITRWKTPANNITRWKKAEKSTVKSHRK